MLTYWDQNKIKKRKLRKLITFRPALQKKKKSQFNEPVISKEKIQNDNYSWDPKILYKDEKAVWEL